MKRTKMTIAIAAVAVFAGAVPGFAKQMETSAMAVDPTPNADKARELRLQAEALFSQPKQWRKAVKLLEQSAELRPASDPEAYTCLLYAGRIQASIGDLAGAQKNLEKAAEIALARGAVMEAAHAYVDAAHVAASTKMVDRAKDLLERATLLRDSPLLSAEQKHILSVRISG
jgi:tetratricopeptide (TPR) repeat protein